MDTDQDPSQLEDLLQSRMVSLVPEIWVVPTTSGQNILESLLKFISEETTDTAQWNKLHLVTSDVSSFEDLSLLDGAARKVEALQALAPGLLAEAAVMVETLQAEDLSRHQVEAIFTKLEATPDPRLRRLLVHNASDISYLDQELMVEALWKLETFSHDMASELSPGHVAALVSRILESSDLRLSQLYLAVEDLTLVPPEVLVGAIQRLQEVDIYGGEMSADQLNAILTMVKEGNLGRLKRIGIDMVWPVWGDEFKACPWLLQEAQQNEVLEFGEFLSY